MIRSLRHVLEHLDTSATVLPQAARPPQFPASRLNLALTSTRRDRNVPVIRFAPALLPGLAVRVPIVVPAPIRLERVRPRTRVVTHVPSLQAQGRFPVASVDLSRKDAALPFGIGRYVNAATLKAIAGGRRVDQLLKKTPAGWEFVPNDTRIDLQDSTQEFRLGRLTIFS